MKILVKLIHKTHTTYLPTKFPVHYYGLPDGKVYLFYARFYKEGFDKSGVEYILATHREFSFDYDNEKLELIGLNNSIYPELVDKAEPKIKILNVYRNINSYSEALARLNKKAQRLKIEMINQKIDQLVPC
ncbi:MAG: hypothetical protein HQ521_02290 [Bacteroidetes bacterium]|nr:hypothetical protein [Bacteroidota bacterium]